MKFHVQEQRDASILSNHDTCTKKQEDSSLCGQTVTNSNMLSGVTSPREEHGKDTLLSRNQDGSCLPDLSILHSSLQFTDYLPQSLDT